MNSYEIPESRLAAVREATETLMRAERIVLTTHVNADGDGAGSEAALQCLLRKAGKVSSIVNPTPFPAHLRFLVEDADSVVDAGSEEAAERCRSADLCVVLDTSERSRLGRVGALVAERPLLVIDHHAVGEDAIDGQALRDVSAAATGELVFDLLWSAGGPWTRSVVEGLYVAIMTDTGSFRFSNVTASVHRIVAELMEKGASPDRLYREVYGRIPLRRIRLLQAILPTLDVSSDGRVAWMTVSSSVFRELGCTSEDLEGLVDYPRELESVEVGLLFRELEGGQVKVSLRSNGAVDVNGVARSFGGGGHLRASGALVPGGLDEVRDRVVAHVVAEAKKVDVEALSGRVAPEP